ncbi:ferrochelatase [Frankineae bacterium MT45]|nr:ferrochelatase [Frankineae bacterium MT45]
MRQYDALLLLSFGGPEGPDDVLPFLRNVTRGRGIPDERLVEVGAHYAHFGGVSPINGQNRALIEALTEAFIERGIELPIYWGNRNWAPYLNDTVAQMAADGIRRALVFATSATSSYSGCRQYRENLADAVAATSDAPELVKLRHYFDHPGFIEANVAGVRAALDELPDAVADSARLVFTAHSIPVTMNESAGPSGGLYLAQQRETARLVAERIRGAGADFDLVWQSRSGPPQVPWLEPDINDHLRLLAEAGEKAVVVSPTGFVSDHLEVAWDLDNEAAATASELGLQFARAACAGTHPAFVGMVCDLVSEQVAADAGRDDIDRPHLGALGLCGLECPAFCCPAPKRIGRPAAE